MCLVSSVGLVGSLVCELISLLFTVDRLIFIDGFTTSLNVSTSVLEVQRTSNLHCREFYPMSVHIKLPVMLHIVHQLVVSSERTDTF